MTKSVLLFVHGLFGDKKTWGDFPALVATDPDLKSNWEAVTYRFPTPYFRLPFLAPTPRIQMLADGLRTEIDARFPDQSIVLVGHSLGGLVVRRYVLDQIKRVGYSNVARVALYATPNIGAGLAHIGKYLSIFQYQIRQLCRNSEFLNELNRDWLDLSINEKISVLCVIGGSDDVVSEEDARLFWPTASVKVVVCATHTNIVKPQNIEDTRYLLLKSFVLNPTISEFDHDTRREAIYLGFYVGQLLVTRLETERAAALSLVQEIKRLPAVWTEQSNWTLVTDTLSLNETLQRLPNSTDPIRKLFTVGFATWLFRIQCITNEHESDKLLGLYAKRDQLRRVLQDADAPKSLLNFVADLKLDSATSPALFEPLMQRIVKWA